MPAERAALKANAAAAGLPLSAFLLAAGLGQTVKSVVDLRQVAELAKVNADLGRLGGLLKLWLTMEGRFVPGYPDQQRILALLDSIRETQDVLKAVAKGMVDRV
ncbi:hypothetical protein FBY14_12432 [Azospirillum brasilense]|nr:hypothetical protein FBY14_12432 [Azospirillum brasilense]